MNRAYISFFILILTTRHSFASDPIDFEVKKNLRKIFDEKKRIARGEIPRVTEEKSGTKAAQELGDYLKLLALVHDFGGLEGLERAAEKAKSNRDWILEEIYNREDMMPFRDAIFRDQKLINALFEKKLRILLSNDFYLDITSFDDLDGQIDYWAFEEVRLNKLTHARRDIEGFKQRGYHFQ